MIDVGVAVDDGGYGLSWCRLAELIARCSEALYVNRV
jgi:hypothetical protein